MHTSFTFNIWNMEIGTVVKMVHDSTQKIWPFLLELMCPDQCDNVIVNHNLVRFACATEIESELPGCQKIVAKSLS